MDATAEHMTRSIPKKTGRESGDQVRDQRCEAIILEPRRFSSEFPGGEHRGSMDRFAIDAGEGCHHGDEEGGAGLRVRKTVVAVAMPVFHNALCLQRQYSLARTLPALPVQPVSTWARLYGETPKASAWFFVNVNAREIVFGVALTPFAPLIPMWAKYCGDHRLGD